MQASRSSLESASFRGEDQLPGSHHTTGTTGAIRGDSRSCTRAQTPYDANRMEVLLGFLHRIPPIHLELFKGHSALEQKTRNEAADYVPLSQ